MARKVHTISRMDFVKVVQWMDARDSEQGQHAARELCDAIKADTGVDLNESNLASIRKDRPFSIRHGLARPSGGKTSLARSEIAKAVLYIADSLALPLPNGKLIEAIAKRGKMPTE